MPVTWAPRVEARYREVPPMPHPVSRTCSGGDWVEWGCDS